MFFPVVLLSLFNLVYTLQCTDNCSMIYSMSQSFILPANCTYISSHRCSVKLIFWYDRENYNVTFTGDLLADTNNIADSRDFIMIETGKNPFFSYDIFYECKETDDCARSFAEEKILQMTKRFYNISKIFADLRRVLYTKSALSQKFSLFRYQ